MPTKAIKFKNGMKLPVFNTETISFTANTPYLYTYEKAAQMIVNNGTILNTGFFNQPYEDVDGNIWTWIYNPGYSPQIKVTRKNGTTITRGLGSLSDNNYSFLYLVSSGANGYNVCVGYRKKALETAISANSQLYVTYVNSTNGTRTYQNDLSNVSNYPNVRLSNRIITNNTVTVTGYYKRNSNGSTTDLDFVFGINSGGTLDTANILATLSNDAFVDLFEKDPYAEGGTSTSGGGGGSFDDSTDVIQIPEYDPVDLVYRSYANRGFVQSYVVTLNEIIDLHTYLWGSSITDTLKKMFADPIQCILSLNLLPFEITSETVSNMIIGTVDTEISTHRLEKQFVTIDCGYIDVTEFWKSYLDFSPYTKASIYLPFVGTREIDIDKIMGRRIGVKYVIDVVSGSAVIYIVDMSGYNNGVFPEDSMVGVLYQYIGNVALQIPISSSSYGEFYASLISGLVTAGASAAAIYSGGMSAPLGVAALSGAALNVASSKPKITASGAMPAISGWMGIQKPYLTIERPRQCLPEDQNTLTGYPAYITVTIGDVEGYNEFEIMHLENIPATEQEKDEIERLLKSGVIL